MKLKRYFLFSVFVSLMIITSVFSQPISVSLPDTSGNPGDTLEIPITVGDLTGQNIIAYQTIITFDGNILNCIGASSAGTLTELWGPPTVNCQTAQILVGSFGVNPLSGAGTLVYLLLEVIGQPGETTALTFNSFIFNAGTPAASTTNGSVTVNIPNQAPIVTAIPDTSMNEGDTLDVLVSANDPDGDPLTLTAPYLPSFGSFTDNGDGTGTFRFTPGFDDAGFYPNIEVIASDGLLSDTASFDLTVNEVNRPPVLDSIPDQLMNEGDTLDVPVSATDPDGNNITLSVTNLPPFGSFTDNGDGTGLIHLTPGFNDAGVYPNIVVTAIDNGAPPLSDSTSFTLTVLDEDRPPSITEIPDTTMNENETLTVPVIASDPDGDPIALTSANLPPFGSFIDNGDGTGQFVFTPGFDDAGSYPNIEVTAVSGTPPLSSTESFELTVNNFNRAPVAVDDSVMTVQDSALSIPVLENDSDPDNDPLTVTALITTNTTKGIASIEPGDTTVSYAPFPDSTGVDEFDYVVSDGKGGLDTATVTITIEPVPGIEDSRFSGIPQNHVLMQNFPNPFNPNTQIRFGLPRPGKVKIEVYNMIGQRVATLLNEHRPAGYHLIKFDARNMASGFYFYRMQSESFEAVRKMLLLR